MMEAKSTFEYLTRGKFSEPRKNVMHPSNQ